MTGEEVCQPSISPNLANLQATERSITLAPNPLYRLPLVAANLLEKRPWLRLVWAVSAQPWRRTLTSTAVIATVLLLAGAVTVTAIEHTTVLEITYVTTVLAAPRLSLNRNGSRPAILDPMSPSAICALQLAGTKTIHNLLSLHAGPMLIIPPRAAPNAPPHRPLNRAPYAPALKMSAAPRK